MSEKPSIPEINSVRGLAALGVLTFHNFGPGFGVSPDAPVSRLLFEFALYILCPGASMVLVFFVMSGFVLSRSAINSEGRLTIFWYFAFWIRRLMRVMPALWLSVVIAVLAVGFNGWLKGVENWPWALGALAALLQTSGFSINPPLWSLQIEVLAYIIFPFIVLLASRAGHLGQLGMVLFAFLFCFVEKEIVRAEVTVPLFCFVLGSVVPTLGKELFRKLSKRACTLVFFLGCSAILAPLPYYMLLNNKAEHYDLVISMGAFIIIACVAYGDLPKTARAVLRSTPVIFLGTISYSLYLLHYPFLDVSYRIIALLFPSMIQWSANVAPFGNTNFIVEVLRLPVLLMLVLPLAWLSYRLVEVPFTELGRRWSERFIRARTGQSSRV